MAAIRKVLAKLTGRSQKKPVAPRPPITDPSGRPATDTSPHLIVEEGAAPFLMRGRCAAGKRLTWRITDTSVVRVTPETDSLSALVTVVGAGITTLTISDGDTCESRQLVVRPLPVAEPKRIAVSLEAAPR